MSTLVLKASGVIGTPQYGKLPDLKSNLRFELDARDLKLTNGAEVTSWVSSKGDGLISERAFNNKFESYEYPKFKNTTIPTVEFNGNAILYNSNDDEVFVQTCTYLLVCRVDELNPLTTGNSRVFSGDISDRPEPNQYHFLRPEAGRMNLIVSKRNAEDTGNVYGTKFDVNDKFWVGVFVLNGANSKHVTSIDDVINRYSQAHGQQDQIFLGGSGTKPASSANDSFKGAISYFAQYGRAFSDDDMTAALSKLKSEFNIQN